MTEREQLRQDMETVANEALRLLRAGERESPRAAVATAVGNVIPNHRGDENYKIDLLVRTTPVVEDHRAENSGNPE